MAQSTGSIAVMTCGLLVRSSVRNGRRAGLELERENSKLDFLTGHLQDNHRLLKKVIQRGRRRVETGGVTVFTRSPRAAGQLFPGGVR